LKPTLIVSKSKTSTPDLLPENAIFLDQILDDPQQIAGSQTGRREFLDITRFDDLSLM